MAADQEKEPALIADLSRLLDGYKDEFLSPLTSAQKDARTAIRAFGERYSLDKNPVDHIYEAWVDSKLLESIYKSARDLVDCLRKLSKEDLVTGSSLSKTFAQEPWPDKPVGKENIPCVDIIDNVVGMVQGNTIELAQSRAAMVALRVVRWDVDRFAKALDSCRDKKDDPAKLGLLPLQDRVEQAIQTSATIQTEFFVFVDKCLEVLNINSGFMGPSVAEFTISELENWSNMFHQTLRFQQALKDGLAVVGYALSPLQSHAQSLLKETEGLHSILMAGDAWSLKFIHQRWKPTIKDLNKLVFGSAGLGRDMKKMIAYQRPNPKDEIGKAYFNSMQSTKKPVQWKSEYTATDHVVVACGLTTVKENTRAPLPGLNIHDKLGVTITQGNPLQMYAERTTVNTGCDLGTGALAVPLGYANTQGIRFSSSKSTDNVWSIEIDQRSRIKTFRQHITFASPFRGKVVQATCWITQYQLDQTYMPPIRSFISRAPRKVILQAKCMSADAKGFDIEVQMTLSAAELYNSDAKSWALDNPPSEIEQSFTVDWIAVEKYTGRWRLLADTKPREGTGVNFRWNWTEFKEPPQVFYGLASLVYSPPNTMKVELSCKTFKDGCHVVTDNNGYQESGQPTIAMVAIGRPLSEEHQQVWSS